MYMEGHKRRLEPNAPILCFFSGLSQTRQMLDREHESTVPADDQPDHLLWLKSACVLFCLFVFFLNIASIELGSQRLRAFGLTGAGPFSVQLQHRLGGWGEF